MSTVQWYEDHPGDHPGVPAMVITSLLFSFSVDGKTWSKNNELFTDCARNVSPTAVGEVGEAGVTVNSTG